MYQIFIKANGKSNPAYLIGLSGTPTYLIFEDKREAQKKATELKLAIAYLINAKAPPHAKIEIKEI